MYDVVEREYIAEKKAAAKEFEEKKIELRENLLSDFEDKRKMIESERHSMELNGDSMEVRKLTYYVGLSFSWTQTKSFRFPAISLSNFIRNGSVVLA